MNLKCRTEGVTLTHMALFYFPTCSSRLMVVLMIMLTGHICNAQSITIMDLEKLTGLTHKEATVYLTAEKHFNSLTPIVIYNRTISQFKRTDGESISELVVKNEWQDTDRTVHATISYEVKPRGYADTLVLQLEQASYHLTSKQADQNKMVWLFENDKYMISIYKFSSEKLPASVQIHTK